MGLWGTVADWLVAAGTLVVAAVAVFQETVRGWFYHPTFEVSAKTEPPDCVAVPFTAPDGTLVANSVYLRLWVKNVGSTTARNVEVYAKELRRQRADGTWERVAPFPPMNLRWANVGSIYFPSIAPEMGKHCDLGHIVDPPQRHTLSALASTGLTSSWPPRNARPLGRTVSISVRGAWDPDETRMLRDGVGIGVV